MTDGRRDAPLYIMTRGYSGRGWNIEFLRALRIFERNRMTDGLSDATLSIMTPASAHNKFE